MATPTENMTDPEAPYGRKNDGTPKKRPGPPKGSSGPGNTRTRVGAGPRAATKARQVDYRPGILGISQALSLPLSMSEKTLPDAWAIDSYAPGVAEALNQLAEERPEVAAMLDRILAAGPYGALIAALLPMLIQIAYNHGLIPESIAEKTGAHSPQAIIMSLREQRKAPDVAQAA